MRCPYCQKENPDQAKFCTGCGRKLELVHQPEADSKNQQRPEIKHPQATEKNPSARGSQPSNLKPKKKKKKTVALLALLLIVVLVVSLFSCGGGSEVEVYEEEEDESSEEIIEETEEEISDYSYQEIDADRIVEEDGLYYVESQILLVADETVSYSEIEELVGEYGGDIVGYLSFTNDYQIDVSVYDSYEELEALCEELASDTRIESAEPAYVQEMTTDNVDYTADPWIDANDTSDTSGSDWDEDDPEGLNWWAEAIGMPSVWAMDLDLTTVKVGIIDSMFDIDNEDLDEGLFVQLWNNPEDENGDCTVTELYEEYLTHLESNPDDTSSLTYHGTHVAGIIAAQAENGFGIAGVSNNVELYGYASQSEAAEDADEATWGSAFTWKYAMALMLNEGVKVINISMGYSESTIEALEAGDEETLRYQEIVGDALGDFLLKYINAGYEFLICKAAGNESTDASYDILGAIEDETVAERIIIVGNAMLYNGYYYIYPGSNTGDRVDVYAPGTNILSDMPGNVTSKLTGTSMAAPIVSGILSLIWGINPDLSSAQVREILIASTSSTLFQEESRTWFETPNGDYELTPIVNAKICVELAQTTTGLSEDTDLSYGLVTGVVYAVDSFGDIQAVIDDVVVTIYDDDMSYDVTLSEISTGSIEFLTYTALLKPGTYEVKISAEGYKTRYQTFSISEGETIEIDLNMESDVNELELYAEILDIFYYGISSQWAYYEEKDIYWYGVESESDHSGSSSTICYMWYWSYAEDLSLSEAGYAFFDLDGDGICELLIDTCNADGSHGSGIRDIYTYRDGEIVHLASISERSDLYLCTDGSIGYQGTTGSGEGGASIYNYYSLDTDSIYLTIKDSLTYIYDEDEYYYSDSAAYTEDEDDVTSHAIAEAIMDSYEALDYELTPFSEYEPTTEMETTTSVDWASVYLDFLESEVTLTDEQWLDYDEIYAYAYEYYEGYEEDLYYGGFSLIYVNDDDIPELVMYGTSEATGMLIFTIGENGDMDVMMSERLNSFYYAEDLNLLVNHAGVTGVSWDTVYTITDGTWVQLASGSYEYYDTDGDGILSYYWNGEEVTEAEYEDNLDEYIMSLTLTYPGTDPEYTLDELISWLEAQ